MEVVNRVVEFFFSEGSLESLTQVVQQVGDFNTKREIVIWMGNPFQE